MFIKNLTVLLGYISKKKYNVVSLLKGRNCVLKVGLEVVTV